MGDIIYWGSVGFSKILSRLCILNLIVLSGLTSDYSNTLVLTDQKDHYKLSGYLDIYEDKSGRLSIEKIVKEDFQSQFKKRKEKNLNFGYSKSSFWARIKIKNLSAEQKYWLLSHHYYLQDEIELFRETQKGVWIGSKTGDIFFFREIEAKLFTFKLKPKGETTYFIKGETANQFDLSLSSPIRFAKMKQKTTIFWTFLD